eukprot:TRINITY_DN3275_c0_g4_i1.p1 TRINITY_DN3275_c0_g4~~TRINITY_DN3275_c0_g4_i1.p1  ORF type:complete len:301 (-),score=28.92 TRINITY_DN3275_c0_g4_i1:539-1441(-)
MQEDLVSPCTRQRVCRVYQRNKEWTCRSCGITQTNSSTYNRRFKVCENCKRASQVTIGDKFMRFCQKCSKFEEVCLFDGERRNCRVRLARNNQLRKQRRKEEQAQNQERGEKPHTNSSDQESFQCQILPTPQTAQSITNSGQNDQIQKIPLVRTTSYVPVGDLHLAHPVSPCVQPSLFSDFQHTYVGGEQQFVLNDWNRCSVRYQPYPVLTRPDFLSFKQCKKTECGYQQVPVQSDIQEFYQHSQFLDSPKSLSVLQTKECVIRFCMKAFGRQPNQLPIEFIEQLHAVIGAGFLKKDFIQ